jgi:hypothetical protein
MRKDLARISRSLVCPLFAGLLVAVVAPGCHSDAAPDEVAIEGAVTNELINGDDLAALAEGESLRVNLGADKVLYHFEFDRPLDWKRIALQFPGNAEVTMDQAMKEAFEHPYSPLEAASHRFVITADPANFGLTEDEITTLRTEGMLTREGRSGAPRAQPQTVDTCIEQTIYFNVTIIVNGVPQTIPCAHTILVCGGTPACSPVSTFNGHNYLFCENQESWDDAQAYCRSFGMNLATINSVGEEGWLYANASAISTQKWWIGLNDRASEGSFVWASGEPVSYTNWYAGEPNNAGGNEDCGQMNRFYPNHGWNDEPCSFHFRHICESD